MLMYRILFGIESWNDAFVFSYSGRRKKKSKHNILNIVIATETKACLSFSIHWKWKKRANDQQKHRMTIEVTIIVIFHGLLRQRRRNQINSEYYCLEQYFLCSESVLVNNEHEKSNNNSNKNERISRHRLTRENRTLFLWQQFQKRTFWNWNQQMNGDNNSRFNGM